MSNLKIFYVHKPYVLCLVTQSCPTLWDPVDCSPQAPLSIGILQKNTRVGCHALLQGIFPSQGSNPGLLHCRQILYCLNHQGSHSQPQLGKNCVCMCVCVCWKIEDYFRSLEFLRKSFSE